MKRLFLISTILFLVSKLTLAQNTYTRLIGSDTSETGYKIIKSINNGFLIHGQASANNFGWMSIMKTDSAGNPIWHKQINDNDALNWSRGKGCIVELSDSTIMAFIKMDSLCSSCAGGKGQLSMIHLSKDGAIINKKLISASGLNSDIDAYIASETPDHKIILACNYNSYLALINIEINGNIIWQKEIKQDPHTANNFSMTDISKIKILKDSTFVLIGGIYYGSSNISNQTLYISKFDKIGTPQWLKTYNTNNYSKGLGIDEDHDGNLYIASTGGGSYSTILNKCLPIHILKIKNNGTILKSKFIYSKLSPLQNKSLYGSDIFFHDNNIYISAWGNFFGGSSNYGLLLKADTSLQINHASAHYGLSTSNNRIYSITNNYYGNIVALGYSSGTDHFFISTNDSTHTNCSVQIKDFVKDTTIFENVISAVSATSQTNMYFLNDNLSSVFDVSAHNNLICEEITTSIKSNSILNNLVFFPNPGNGVINFYSKDEDVKQIEVYNARGELIDFSIDYDLKTLTIPNQINGLFIIKYQTQTNKSYIFKYMML